MNDIAIRIEGLGKRYRYGGAAPLSSNLRADVTDWVRGLWTRRGSKIEAESVETPSPFMAIRSSSPTPNSKLQTPTATHHHETLHEVHERHIAVDPNYFWALRDINLEVRQGEVFGIIGRNGAGMKSDQRLETNGTRVPVKFVEQFMTDVLLRVGCDQSVAQAVGAGLAETSLRGVDSHGIRLFPHYVRALEGGRINGFPRYRFERHLPAAARLDGDHTYGHASGIAAMNHAIQMANEAGKTGEPNQYRDFVLPPPPVRKAS